MKKEVPPLPILPYPSPCGQETEWLRNYVDSIEYDNSSWARKSVAIEEFLVWE